MQAKLWGLISGKDKKYDQAMALINEYPELVNSIGDDEISLVLDTLRVAITPTKAILDFLTFIANHPNFNTFSYIPNCTKKSTIDDIFGTCSDEVLKIFINRSDIIFNRSHLSYIDGSEKLKLVKDRYLKNLKKDPNAGYTKRSKTHLDNITIMVARIRDKTIRHALANDDPSILEALSKAGDYLGDPLMNGEYCYTLAKKQGCTKILDWFASIRTSSIASLATSSNNLFKTGISMVALQKKMSEEMKRADEAQQLVKELEKKIEELEKEKAELDKSSAELEVAYWGERENILKEMLRLQKEKIKGLYRLAFNPSPKLDSLLLLLEEKRESSEEVQVQKQFLKELSQVVFKPPERDSILSLLEENEPSRDEYKRPA